jgi:hypothetical protein
MHLGKMYFYSISLSNNMFRCIDDHHQGVLKNSNVTYNKLLTCAGKICWSNR